MKNVLRRSIAVVMIAAVAGTAVPAPAFAGMIPTEAAAVQRDRVASLLSRAEVRARLEAYGVRPEEVAARVDALSAEEVARLAARIEALPAGGDGIIGAALFVFVLLLVTDLLGLTKVFPFTRR
jgi:hypothetical protein